MSEENEQITIDIMGDVLDLIIDKCNKYNLDKDNTVKGVAENLVAMTEICTFQNYKKENKYGKIIK